MYHSSKPFTFVIASPFGTTGAAAGIFCSVYDTTGTVVTNCVFTEIKPGVYQSEVSLPRGGYTFIASVPWDTQDIVKHINVTDQPLTTVEYLGMRG